MSDNAKFAPVGHFLKCVELKNESTTGLVFETTDSAFVELKVLDYSRQYIENGLYVSTDGLPYCHENAVILAPRSATRKIHIDDEDFIFVRFEEVYACK